MSVVLAVRGSLSLLKSSSWSATDQRENALNVLCNYVSLFLLWGFLSCWPCFQFFPQQETFSPDLSFSSWVCRASGSSGDERFRLPQAFPGHGCRLTHLSSLGFSAIRSTCRIHLESFLAFLCAVQANLEMVIYFLQPSSAGVADNVLPDKSKLRFYYIMRGS